MLREPWGGGLGRVKSIKMPKSVIFGVCGSTMELQTGEVKMALVVV